MSSDIAIEAAELCKTYFLYDAPIDRLRQFFTKTPLFTRVEALRPLSFSIGKGETVGVVGRNGSGKSTLLQLLCGTLNPSGGTLAMHGRVSALLELGAGFNPDFTGRENVYLNGAILGLSQAEIAKKFAAIETFADIGIFMDQPVKTYSSGMFVRLAFAVAVTVEPDILIVDEALSVGDEAFQRKCFARIRALQQRGCTILFVSHSVNTILEICDRVLFLDRGEKMMDGDPKSVISAYQQWLFCPEDHRETLRTRIRNGEINFDDNDPEPSAHDSALVAPYFDPGLIASTTGYTPQGAEISAPYISTLAGEKVNVLKRGETYQFHYDLTINAPIYDLSCGMMIKTKTDLRISGAQAEITSVSQPPDTHRITFHFTCHLLPGTYYINCTARGRHAPGDEQRPHLHRLVDAAIFRVEFEKDLLLSGMLDLAISLAQ